MQMLNYNPSLSSITNQLAFDESSPSIIPLEKKTPNDALLSFPSDQQEMVSSFPILIPVIKSSVQQHSASCRSFSPPFYPPPLSPTLLSIIPLEKKTPDDDLLSFPSDQQDLVSSFPILIPVIKSSVQQHSTSFRSLSPPFSPPPLSPTPSFPPYPEEDFDFPPPPPPSNYSFPSIQEDIQFLPDQAVCKPCGSESNISINSPHYEIKKSPVFYGYKHLQPEIKAEIKEFNKENLTTPPPFIEKQKTEEEMSPSELIEYKMQIRVKSFQPDSDTECGDKKDNEEWE